MFFTPLCTFHHPELSLTLAPADLCNRKRRACCLNSWRAGTRCSSNENVAMSTPFRVKLSTFATVCCGPLFSSSRTTFFTKKWSLVLCLIATAQLHTSWVLLTKKSVVSFAYFWVGKCCPCCHSVCNLGRPCANMRVRWIPSGMQKWLHNLFGWCKVWATDCFEKLIFVFKVLSALYSAFSTTLPFVAEYSLGKISLIPLCFLQVLSFVRIGCWCVNYLFLGVAILVLVHH